MSAVLIVGDTIRTPELRHEVPLGIPDAFFYAEVDGRRIVTTSPMEAARVDGLETDLEVHTTEEFGADELRRSGIDPHVYRDEVAVRVVRGLGIATATVPQSFPLGIANALGASGVELVVDQKFFDDRRRHKSSHELAGIRRAQRQRSQAWRQRASYCAAQDGRTATSCSTASRSPARSSRRISRRRFSPTARLRRR
jgi:Xaa-Pro aminopeptidase